MSRTDRSVLDNLGQLFRHDLSESYGLAPNADGTFNFRQLDLFRTDPGRRGWLIHAGDALAGFALTRPMPDGATSITAFFVVRAFRRRAVGAEAVRLLLTEIPGRWTVAFQDYNPGAREFWTSVAAAAVGPRWSEHADPSVNGRPPDIWLTFDTSG